MSANYFNLGGGADHSSSLNRCQELLTIDGDTADSVHQALFSMHSCLFESLHGYEAREAKCYPERDMLIHTNQEKEKVSNPCMVVWHSRPFTFFVGGGLTYS